MTRSSSSLVAAALVLSSAALLFFACFTIGAATDAGSNGLRLGYYSETCPRAEDIVKEQVSQLYHKHGNTAVSWLRALFHDCMVTSCDASLLLDTTTGGTGGAVSVSEKASPRSFGMRNFKYIDVIKAALERECPGTVSCADVLALAARDGAAILGGPRVGGMRTGRRDSRESHYGEVERKVPDHNATVAAVLARFAAVGVDAEGAVALLGAHSVGRVHCDNLVHRLYPALDAGVDPEYGAYLRRRCPAPAPAAEKEEEEGVAYARNDRDTPMVLDNMYYKNLVKRRGLLLVDQRLADDPRTAAFVARMAADNAYFHDRFAAALLAMSEYNPLGDGEGKVRRHCRFVNPPA